jgi:probable addiction module antidote protein
MKKRKTTYKTFDAAAYLDHDAVIAEYLSAAAEDPNPDVFVAALGDVAKARGMAQIAKDSGLGRESLYKALSAVAHPRFETINSVLRALGVKIAVVAEHGSSGEGAAARVARSLRFVQRGGIPRPPTAWDLSVFSVITAKKGARELSPSTAPKAGIDTGPPEA